MDASVGVGLASRKRAAAASGRVDAAVETVASPLRPTVVSGLLALGVCGEAGAAADADGVADGRATHPLERLTRPSESGCQRGEQFIEGTGASAIPLM